MTNSLSSGAVILLARALEDNICCLKFQIYIAEIACMHLESITLALVTITRVEGDVIREVI